MPTIVCSQSTKNFIKTPCKKFIISKAPDESILRLRGTETDVIAVGGGAVMDVAKILSSTPIVAYPTTASGACMTSHAVVWSGTIKKSIKTSKPKIVFVKKEFLKTLPKTVFEHTWYDALAHCIEGLMSQTATKESNALAFKGLKMLNRCKDAETLVKAGNIGGQVIEITGTNLYHALSYPLTAHYGIPHGKALGFLFGKVEIPNIDMEFVIDEALKYEKIYSTKIPLDKEKLMRRFN